MFRSLPDLILGGLALLPALVLHEYAHARVAVAMGDPTPRLAGRLSFNPLRHLDLIGAIMLLFAGFGWARPVPINPYNFYDRRRGLLLVSLAGPLTNLVLGFAAALLYYLFSFHTRDLAGIFLSILFQYNIALFVFNLIPIPPLDGSKVLQSLLPGRQAYFFAQLEPYGWLILIGVLYFGIADVVLGPLNYGARSLVSGLARVVAGRGF